MGLKTKRSSEVINRKTLMRKRERLPSFVCAVAQKSFRMLPRFSMKHMHFLFLGVVLMFLSTQPAAATTKSSKPSARSPKAAHPATMARNPYRGAIVVEAATGRVLFEDQADVQGYPASMQKLMDLLIILERLEHGQLSLTDQVPVSAKAAQTG